MKMHSNWRIFLVVVAILVVMGSGQNAAVQARSAAIAGHTGQTEHGRHPGHTENAGHIDHAGQSRTALAAPDHALSESQTVLVQFGGVLGANYSPKNLFITPGTEVHWQGDFTMHPLVSDGGLWQTVQSGTDFNFTFNQPGVYAYHCLLHGGFGMTGTVTVGFQVMLPVIRK